MKSIRNLFIRPYDKPFNLSRQFALLSLFCIIIIGTFSTVMMSRLMTEKILLRDATLSKEFITSVIATEGAWKLFLETPGGSAEQRNISGASRWALETFLTHLALLPDVIRANVYSKNGALLWSSNPDIMGEHYKDNEELETSLNGELVYESGVIGSDDKEEHKGFDDKVQGSRFIETYIPVWARDHKEVIGAVELYRAPLMLNQSIVEAQRLIWIGALTGGLLLFISLYWIVKRASFVMEHQQQRLLEAKSFSVIGQTASAIIHAMRNPLSSIRACAELSLIDDLEGVRESARDIMGETDRLDRWAQELLYFSATDNDSPEHLDINELVTAVIKEHEAILERYSISCRLRPTKVRLPVAANFTPLSQVFGNLIMNAIQAMEGDQGELIITTSYDSYRKYAIVTLADSGPGLSKEVEDKLFQPFVTTKSSGTGLGLALSRHLVEHYSGILEISSKPGQGVTVTVCLPTLG